VMAERPQLFWGMIVSMWIGNLMLVILNLPLIGIWIKLLQVPYRLLFPSIMIFMAIGTFSVANNPVDLVIMAAFGLFGLACMKFGMEPAPLALGVVLGPLMEENLRRAMLLARGDPSVFLTRPISAGFIIASILMLLLISLPIMRRKRAEVFSEEPTETAAGKAAVRA
jgi:putative tricarboxylic transport membrane protein